jgi:membrane fusion protein, multidrug efflux system
MRKLFSLASMLLLLWIGFSGCTGSGDAQKLNDKTSSRPPVAVEATKAILSDLTEGIDAVGSLSYKFGAEVKSEYAGIVNEVCVAEWVTVKKGTPLARVDTRELEINLQKAKAAAELARANLVQAEAAGSRAERNYERFRKLGQVGAIAQQSLDDAATEREVAAARIGAAKAQLNVAAEDVQHAQTRFSKSVICSPMDGVVSSRGVNVGDLVGEAGSTKVMFRIINPSILELIVTVPSREMEAVRVGQSLTFSTDSMPGKTFTGRVMFINPAVNEADRSVKVTAEVENLQGQLKGGLFVKGRIITGKRSDVLKIPRAALLNWDVAAKKGELFVVEAEIARRRTVSTGSVLEDYVEIRSGLQASEQVITRGGFNVKDGDRVALTQVHGG